MKAYLSFFFFTLLLSTAASLRCETCIGIGKHCSGTWETCGSGLDTCATILSKGTVDGTTAFSVVKSCNSREICNKDMNSNVLGTTIVTKVECSKAAGSSGSFFLSLLSLLVVKMLL